MTLNSVTANLIVADVTRTVDWYLEVLGFQFTVGVVEGTEDSVFEATGQPLGFAMLKRDAVELMFQSHASVAVELPDMKPATGNGVALYIDVDDVDELHAELSEHVDIVVGLNNTFYGAREFHLRDCNGMIVGFAQRLQPE